MKIHRFGIPVTWDEKEKQIVAERGISVQSRSEKRFGEMENLVYEPGNAPRDEVCYVFFQNIWEEDKEAAFTERKVTNGITVLSGGTMGMECRKNSGHYHGLNPGHTLPYPEAYEVLWGQAVFLLQKSGNFEQEDFVVEDLEAVFVNEGEKLVVPPFCGHCVANVGEGSMAFGNLAVPCPLHYEPIKKKHGFAVYVLKVDGRVVFVPNENYGKVPRLRVSKAKERPDLGLVKGKALYTSYTERPERFEYLWEPEKYRSALER
ncbi:MAG: hypothetical protein HFI68_05570 [Lachnospiraceae bacterium]|nr:hypothetical protein [Lachnospiraceae bacterium]